jgi:hypothetical protein
MMPPKHQEFIQPLGSAKFPTLHSLYISDAPPPPPNARNYTALFADDTCISATLQTALYS